MTRLFRIGHPPQNLHHQFWPRKPEFFQRCDENCPWRSSDHIDWLTDEPLVHRQSNGPADFLFGTKQVQCLEHIAKDIASKFRGIQLAKNYCPIKISKSDQKILDSHLGIDANLKIIPRREWVHSPEEVECNYCGRYSIKSATVTTVYQSIPSGDSWIWGREYERKPGEGYLIPRSIIRNLDAINLQGYILFTERLKNYIEFKQYTNVDLLEYGEIVEDIPYTEPTNDAILAKLWENSS